MAFAISKDRAGRNLRNGRMRSFVLGRPAVLEAMRSSSGSCYIYAGRRKTSDHREYKAGLILDYHSIDSVAKTGRVVLIR
jgi:hypothetical protein